jgi:hypothetical protein
VFSEDPERYNSFCNRAAMLVSPAGSAVHSEWEAEELAETMTAAKWLCSGNCQLEETTQAKLYVAITQAFFSVGIVVEDNFNKNIPGIKLWAS